ncbi:MAG: Holliday junction resolvase Hjc [Candidatus Diapherotrites archaeon]|nr:Holliday junction resolvase Hjc [Candidatus Diapherotrites archaeon]
MTRYTKGANAERELIKVLWNNGFATVRAAGSGVTPLPSPDLIALGNGKKLAFECKAWDSAYLNLSVEQFLTTKQWCSIAGSEFFIAWKVPNKGWLFLKPETFVRNPKNFTISLKTAKVKAVPLNVILGKQSLLDNLKNAGGVD